MTTMTDSAALNLLAQLMTADNQHTHHEAFSHIAARLREPAGVDYNYRAIAHLIGSIFFSGDFKAETANERTLESLLKEVGTRYTSLAEVEAGYEALSTPQPPAEAQAQVPSYDALLIIAQSVCGALERAGITDCDDPGEAIDVLRERYEAQAQAGSGSPMLATPEQVGLLQGPDDCPHLQINGVSVAVFPAGTWAEVCDALDSITGSTAPPSALAGEFVQHPSGDGTIARKSDPLTPLAVDEILAAMNRRVAPVGVEGLVAQLIAAFAADEAGDGHDIAAGLMGPAVSAWIQSLAKHSSVDAVEGSR